MHRAHEALGLHLQVRLAHLGEDDIDRKLAFGMGYFTRKGTEQLLYGTRGRGLKQVDNAVRQCLLAERREHSRKPDEAAEALERLFGPVRRVELFARHQRPGWDVWGSELSNGSDAVLPDLRSNLSCYSRFGRRLVSEIASRISAEAAR